MTKPAFNYNFGPNKEFRCYTVDDLFFVAPKFVLAFQLDCKNKGIDICELKVPIVLGKVALFRRLN